MTNVVGILARRCRRPMSRRLGDIRARLLAGTWPILPRSTSVRACAGDRPTHHLRCHGRRVRGGGHGGPRRARAGVAPGGPRRRAVGHRRRRARRGGRRRRLRLLPRRARRARRRRRERRVPGADARSRRRGRLRRRLAVRAPPRLGVLGLRRGPGQQRRAGHGPAAGPPGPLPRRRPAGARARPRRDAGAAGRPAGAPPPRGRTAAAARSAAAAPGARPALAGAGPRRRRPQRRHGSAVRRARPLP
jgi:hypothetical protein